MNFLLGKISAAGMILATSLIVTGCETTAGKPELCNNQKDLRCAKVKPVTQAKAKARVRPQTAAKASTLRSSEY